jgi:RNA polymerase sigma-70 factor, ECF subfamily
MNLLQRQEPDKRERFENEALPLMQDMFQLAVHSTRNPDNASDLVQETFLKAYKEFHRYAEGTNIRAWLARILTNTYFNKAKRGKLEDEHFVRNIDFSDVAERVVVDENPDDFDLAAFSTAGNFRDEVKVAIDSLSDEMRTVLLLADLFDYSYTEISQVIDRPVGTVMSRLHRARKQLQDQLYTFAVKEGYIRPQPIHGVDSSAEKPSETLLSLRRHEK